MIVAKFGGTSVGDAACIIRVSEIIAARRERRPVVVVSAMAGVTNALIEISSRAARGDIAGAMARLERLRERHEAAARGAIPAPAPRGQALEALAEDFTDLASMLEALALLRETGPRAQDAVVSRGELWSAHLVARTLEARGVPGTWVDARDVVVTDENFGRAAPQMDQVIPRARTLLAGAAARGCVPVTQGFVGGTRDGRPTTLGRGGSDYSAAILGAALEAEDVEIWTDVDGIMSADPRVVPDARALPDASYDEAAELSYFGARVLHPATILPVIERGIPVWVKNSWKPDAPGTRIVRTPPSTANPVKSIASKRGITTIHLRAPRMLGAHGFLNAMFDTFERHQAGVDVVTTSEVSVSVSLEDGDADPALIRDLEALGDVTVNRDRAIVCVVGEGLRGTPGVAARIFGALADINIEMISQGASKINVTFVVREDHAIEAVRRLHAEFFRP